MSEEGLSPQQAVQEALQEYLNEDEIVVAWTVTMEVMSLTHGRFLAHRTGGGGDGQDAPTTWALYGMRGAALDSSANDLRRGIRRIEHPDDADEEDE